MQEKRENRRKKIIIYSLKGIKENNKKGGFMIRRTCSYVYFNTRDEFIARGGVGPYGHVKVV